MVERVAIYGASNAAGWTFTTHGVDYHCSNLVSAAIEKPPFVQVASHGIIIDLRENPKIEEESHVLNAAIPGAMASELLARFGEDVLEAQPTHVFIWTGLNDISEALHALHKDELPESDDLSDTFVDIKDPKTGLEVASGIIFHSVEQMASTTDARHIKPILGTIPPYTSTLVRWKNDPERIPITTFLLSEGPTLINLVNTKIRELGRDYHVVDAHSLVVDKATGLTRAEYSYGETVPNFQGDILHLNSFGQIEVAKALCGVIFETLVTIVPPARTRLRRG